MRLAPKPIASLWARGCQPSLSRYRALSLSVVAALTYPLALAAKPAAATPVADGQADAANQARQTASQLEQLAGQFDASLGHPDAIGLQLASAQTALAQTQGQADAAAAQLRAHAVDSYVEGGSSRIVNVQLSGRSGYDASVRKEYLATVTSDAQDAVHRLDHARSVLRAQQAKLEWEEQAATAAVARAASAPGDGALAEQDPAGSLTINGPQDFAVALLRTIGAPVTPQNTEALLAWYKREGGAWGSPARFNPFNTSMKMPGSHAINGDGVQAYTSWSQGLTATVATLNGGAYRAILRALLAGTSVQAVEQAVASSPWGTHF